MTATPARSLRTSRRLLDETGLVDVELDYVVSSGLARPDFHDWPAHLADTLDTSDPDIVIVTFGGNDAQGLTEPCPNGAGTCGLDVVVAPGHRVQRRRVDRRVRPPGRRGDGHAARRTRIAG